MTDGQKTPDQMNEVKSPTAIWRASHGLVILPTIFLGVFFLLPFLIMVLISFFTRVQGGFFTPDLVFSSYVKLASLYFGRILLFSLELSFAAAVIAVALAFPFTYFLAQQNRKIQAVIFVFLLSVLSLSEVIIGFSWSSLLSQTAGIGNLLVWLGLLPESRAFTPGLFALLSGLTYLGFPFAVLLLYPETARLDRSLIESAAVLGANPLRRFTTVILPLMRQNIMTAVVLVFIFTLGSYLLPQVLGRPPHWTVSVHITDEAIFQSNMPLAAAMAVVLLLFSLLVVWIGLRLRGAGTKTVKESASPLPPRSSRDSGGDPRGDSGRDSVGDSGGDSD